MNASVNFRADFLMREPDYRAFILSTYPFYRWMLLYVYIPLLETELADLKMAYNSHKIRKQKGKLRPDGCPDDMYRFPERFGKYIVPKLLFKGTVIKFDRNWAK